MLLFILKHFILMKQHTNLCIANAKTSAFINECTFVSCWSDGIWCPTEHRDVLKSQLARPLASCSVLFQLSLVACHIQKDLRELLRSTGLQWCFSSWYAHPRITDSFISLKAGATLYMQRKTSVCAYVKLNIPIYICIITLTVFNTPVPFPSAALCLAS